MNLGLATQFSLLMIMCALWLYVKTRGMLRAQQAPPAHVVAEPEGAAAALSGERADLPAYDLTPLPGAARALTRPPADLRYALAYMKAHYPNHRYSIPLGWELMGNNQADCVTAHLVDDTYHTLITGQSRAGKDNLALNMLFALTDRYGPDQLQVAIIDGKGLDFVGWAGKAHTAHLALAKEEIRPAMEALSTERARRGKMLTEARVSKWENYKGVEALPLLVIYISELSLLEDAVGAKDLTSWMNSELAAGAAFGMRYIVASQTASNFATRWRTQISLYLAAFQPSQSQDQPNTGLTTTEISKAGGVPPSELPAPPHGAGVFTAVQGRAAVTIRASQMDDEQRQARLDRMPTSDAHQLLKALHAGLPLLDSVAPATGHSNGLNRDSVAPEGVLQDAGNVSVSATLAASVAPPLVAVEKVPVEDQSRILAAAQTAKSRGKLCQDLYGVRGGQKYNWVQLVCDAAGLLMAPAREQEQAA